MLNKLQMKNKLRKLGRTVRMKLLLKAAEEQPTKNTATSYLALTYAQTTC